MEGSILFLVASMFDNAILGIINRNAKAIKNGITTQSFPIYS